MEEKKMKEKQESHLLNGLKQVFTLRGVVALGLTGFAVSNLVKTFDLIPDTVPAFGSIDDVAFVLLSFWLLRDAIGWVMHRIGMHKDA
jgi:uncharacterized membrane protein YkvA (DUF1232 family)